MRSAPRAEDPAATMTNFARTAADKLAIKSEVTSKYDQENNKNE